MEELQMGQIVWKQQVNVQTTELELSKMLMKTCLELVYFNV